jgi:hypothetical protein
MSGESDGDVFGLPGFFFTVGLGILGYQKLPANFIKMDF